jgi:acyl-CoA thioesterase FadM
MAWPRRHDGRKFYSGTCLYAADGRLLAQAEAVWIAVDATAVRPV